MVCLDFSLRPYKENFWEEEIIAGMGLIEVFKIVSFDLKNS